MVNCGWSGCVLLLNTTSALSLHNHVQITQVNLSDWNLQVSPTKSYTVIKHLSLILRSSSASLRSLPVEFASQKFTSGSEHLSKTFERFPACGKFGLDWPNDHCCARHASEMPTAFSFCGSAHLHMPRPEAVPLKMVLNQFIKMSEGSPIKWEQALDRKFIPQSPRRPKRQHHMGMQQGGSQF